MKAIEAVKDYYIHATALEEKNEKIDAAFDMLGAFVCLCDDINTKKDAANKLFYMLLFIRKMVDALKYLTWEAKDASSDLKSELAYLESLMKDEELARQKQIEDLPYPKEAPPEPMGEMIKSQ